MYFIYYLIVRNNSLCCASKIYAVLKINSKTYFSIYKQNITTTKNSILQRSSIESTRVRDVIIFIIKRSTTRTSRIHSEQQF